MADSVDQIFTLQKDIGLIQKHIDVLQSKIADKLAVETKSSKLLQLESKLESRIKKIDKVFYSHMHADQTHGINDLRSFFISNKKPINVFADVVTSKYLRKTFSYCFDTYNKEYPATLKINKINKKLSIKGKGQIKLQNKFEFIDYKAKNNGSNLNLVSNIELSELDIKNQSLIKEYLPKTKDTLNLKDHKIQINILFCRRC